MWEDTAWVLKNCLLNGPLHGWKFFNNASPIIIPTIFTKLFGKKLLCNLSDCVPLQYCLKYKEYNISNFQLNALFKKNEHYFELK
jgi:hypothetical protein